MIHWHLRICKSTSRIIPRILDDIGPILLKEDDEMCSAALVRKRCDAEMSTCKTYRAWDSPLIKASRMVLSRGNGGVLGGPRDVVTTDGFVAVLKREIIGIAKRGRRMNASDRHGCY